ncbi:sterol desaturase family protein [uncultured Algimonas sp.]|uniref:sterol desaturase family protein n=1 Tax=uncultured Algimonas sp. TaxID=1547920 RepID=UPI0026285941|nr:sterol desaturase family protein [uncultured Algimonas sp.]
MDDIIETLGGPASLYILAVAYFGMVIAERLWHLFRRSPDYDDRDALCSIGLNLMNSAIGMVVGLILPLALYLWVFDTARLTTLDALWLSVPVAFVLHELAYYVEHRMGHRIGLLWAFHSIHHSSNSFNHTTAARGFYLDGKLQIMGALAAALLGVPPVVYVAVAVAKSLYGIWNHASYVGRLGGLDRIFATPMNHKIHHANQPDYIDRNYGQVLMICDDLFGSRAHYTIEPVVGLVEPVTDNNPLSAQFVGLRQLARKMASADRWSDRLAYLWRPPEWSHDGRCHGVCPKYARRAEAAANL